MLHIIGRQTQEICITLYLDVRSVCTSTFSRNGIMDTPTNSQNYATAVVVQCLLSSPDRFVATSTRTGMPLSCTLVDA